MYNNENKAQKLERIPVNSEKFFRTVIKTANSNSLHLISHTAKMSPLSSCPNPPCMHCLYEQTVAPSV